MGSSEGNKIGDDGFKPSEPSLCANGCGFFGTAATMGLCSKCFRDRRVEEERTASAKAALEKLVNPEPDKADRSVESIGSSSKAAVVVDKPADQVTDEKAAAKKNRCSSCNKKVGVLGFQCRCGGTFCGAHRYAETHACTFDFKGQGRESISKANPVIKADKIDRI